MNKVALTRFDGSLTSTIGQGIEMIEGLSNLTNPVLIKPNICTRLDGTGHSVTDVKVVEAVIDLVLKENPDATIKIIESDSQSKDTMDAFERLGYTQLRNDKKSEGYDIDLINLSEEPLVELTIDVLHYDSVNLHQILTQPHFFISVAITKTHETAFLTSAIKNHFGLLPRKGKSAYHSDIHEIIVDLNKAVPPDLCIIDGRVAVEGWNGPRTRDLGVFVIGKNPVAVDATVTRIMGFEVDQIKHLKLAESIGMGTLNPEVLGESIDSVRISCKAPF